MREWLAIELPRQEAHIGSLNKLLVPAIKQPAQLPIHQRSGTDGECRYAARSSRQNGPGSVLAHQRASGDRGIRAILNDWARTNRASVGDHEAGINVSFRLPIRENACNAEFSSVFNLAHPSGKLQFPMDTQAAQPGSASRPRAESKTVLRLPRSVYNQLRAHGEQTYPNECCGALLGRPTPTGWEVVYAIRAGNARADSSHNSYEIAPSELIKILRDARSRNLEIAGFYHSHPTTRRSGR